MKLSQEDQRKLAEAAIILAHPSFTRKITHSATQTIEKTTQLLPEQLTKSLTRITHSTLEKSLDSALLTLHPQKHLQPRKKTHQLFASISGAAGGAFGLPALAIELPVSTAIMLRSIAEIARSQGENINSPETKLACLEVFALGHEATPTKDTETGYYAIRSLLAKSMSDAASRLTVQELSKQSSPALVKLLKTIATRFSITVSEKMAAQSIPAIGAIGGASINLLFIRYFQEIAEAHFAVRFLEKKYTTEHIEKLFKQEVNRL